MAALGLEDGHEVAHTDWTVIFEFPHGFQVLLIYFFDALGRLR